MARAKYEIEHSVGFSHFPEKSTQWLRERKRHLLPLSFESLRDALHEGVELNKRAQKRHARILKQGRVEAAIQSKITQQGDISLETIDATYQPALLSTSYLMARMAEEMAIVLRVRSSAFEVDGRYRNAPPDYRSAFTLKTSKKVTVTLSDKKIYVIFKGYVYNEAEQRELLSDPEKIDTDGLVNAISTLAHEMYHVRAAVHDPVYFAQTEQAAQFMLRPRRRESFTSEKEWQQFQQRRELGKKLYHYNIGEFAAVKFQRLFLLFLAERLEAVYPKTRFDEKLVESIHQELFRLRNITEQTGEFYSIKRGRDTGELKYSTIR